MGLWLARDKSGELWVYDNKPQRYDNYYRNKDEDIRCFAEPIYESLYPEVTFENSPVELVPKMVDKSQTKYCGSYTTTTSVDNKNRRQGMKKNVIKYGCTMCCLGRRESDGESYTCWHVPYEGVNVETIKCPKIEKGG